MILIAQNIADNFITMIRGLVNRILLIVFLFFAFSSSAMALEKIGIITDTLLTPVNYYNAYYRTPEFFAQDIRGQLLRKNVEVVPIDLAQDNLKKAGLYQQELQAFQALQQGYNIDFKLLKKIAKHIGVKKIVVVTMGMDIQRDFLKNTIWNIANVPGMDVVNPTHRVSVYVGFFDVQNETVLWESIYAKNIRNNKMKNLDTTISNNYEGMLRLKEYSKYISPDVAYNVKMKMLNVNYVEAPTYITRENLKQYAKDKHNIGVKKELSEIDRKKWDTDKLEADTKANIKKWSNNAKDGVVNAGKSTAKGYRKAESKVKTGINNQKIKIKNSRANKPKKENFFKRLFKKETLL